MSEQQIDFSSINDKVPSAPESQKNNSHHTQLQERLQAELKEHQEHINEQQKRLSDKEQELKQFHAELLEKSKLMEQLDERMTQLHRYEHELENREITVRHLEGQLKKLRDELSKKEKQLHQKDVAVDKLQHQLSDAQHQNEDLLKAQKDSTTMLREEDEAITYLQSRIEQQQKEFAKQSNAGRMHMQRQKHIQDSKALTQLMDDIRACEILIEMKDKQGAKEQYAIIKREFERIENADRELYERIIHLHDRIVGMHNGV